MASCSKNEPQAPDKDAWIYDLSLPVPIRFGSATPLTKAAVESLEGLEISLWGFDKYADLGNIHDSLILFNNAHITVQGGVIETGKYYPRDSKHHYAFYACYPRKNNPKEINGDIHVTAPLNGEIDYLWACARTTGDGYNAKFIRENSSKQPTLTFEHVLAAIDFVALADSNSNQNTDSDFTGITVKSVTVKNVPSNGTLVVAGAEEGNIINLTDEKDVLVFSGEENPTVSGTSLGSQYLICPNEEGYDIEVKAYYEAFNETVTMIFKTGQLVKGQKYVFQIKFHKAEDITINIVNPTWDSTSTYTVDFDQENPTPELQDS